MVYASKDISESVPFDLTIPKPDTSFSLTNIAYDLTIDDIPFIMKVSNQNPYRRETAQYKKDQFDSSTEPGEQSLSGWWLRSQTSFHNGSGLKFYEPGTDYQHVGHRFADSRGIDVWNIGQASLLPEVFHAYTGTGGINACQASNGSIDFLVSGNSNGILEQIALNGDDTIPTTPKYVKATTSYLDGHSGTNYPIQSVATDGTSYFAVCSGAIHKGLVGTPASDVIFARHDAATNEKASIHYAKGFIFFGENNSLRLINTSYSSGVGHTGAFPTSAQYDVLTHIDSGYAWNGLSGGPNFIYASGSSNGRSEIWKIGFDATPTGSTLLPDMAGATVAVELPFGEIVTEVKYYIGYLLVATTKGIRICNINVNGDLILGPLVVSNKYAINGFVGKDVYVYAATKLDSDENPTYTHAALIRIDLSTQFDDGSFAWAYDLEYRSSVNTEAAVGFTAESSEASAVFNLDDKLVIVTQEDGVGELQVEHSTRKRDTGWLQTGKIRYGTIEPKWFRYINIQCDTGQGDNIVVSSIQEDGTETNISTLSESISNQDIFITKPSTSTEILSFKFTLNNTTEDADVPVLKAYQIKALPAGKRQKLIQYPLSCFDNEMDRYSSVFGYEGRSVNIIQRLESIEQTGKFVTVNDYRTGESYEGIIEDVRFSNESSSDKKNSGFGGLLLVTIRKI